jgi:hypothetical protein
MASNQGKHRRGRLFEQLMQTAYEDGMSLEVMVATRRGDQIDEVDHKA